MDFKGLIEFNKATLALAAACFAYALEKFVPMPTTGGRYLVLALLAVFMLSLLCALALFAVATAALHREAGTTEDLETLIRNFGVAHMGLLFIGVLMLGGMLVDRVLAEPPKTPAGCCVVAPAAGAR
jgi:hypothetical protein